MRHFPLLLFVIAVFTTSSPAQEQRREVPRAIPAPKDTTRTQASAEADTTEVDTLGRMSTPSLVGTFDRSLDSARFITREQMHWMDFTYLGDILASFSGTVPRDQNAAGQYSQITFGGIDWRGTSVSMNGRPMNDPASGIYNLYQFSSEYADRIEVITGPRAFLYGMNAAGAAINLVTRNYNSNKPYTKLNYSEGPYNYSYSDGTFSQNLSRKVNLTFGFQHQGVDGRFLNGAHDAWNMRLKVRYNVSPDFNVIASEYLTNAQTSLNGGINRALSGEDSFDPRLATVVNTDAYEKISRHDAELAFVGTFLNDSTNVSMLSLYYSHNLREYRDEENRTLTNGILVQSDHTSSWMGAHFTQDLDAGPQHLSVGANLEIRQVEGSPNIGRRRNFVPSAWGKEEVRLGEFMTIAGFGRIDRYQGKTYAGAGGDARLRLTGAFSLFGGMSFSNRVPTYTEQFWIDSTVARPNAINPEKHRQFEAGMELSFPGSNSMRVAYFHRTVLDPILALQQGTGERTFPPIRFVNGETMATNGLETRLALRWKFLFLEGTGTYLLQRSNGVTLKRYPKFSALGGIYYWNSLVNGHLELKAGFRGRYQSPQAGERFNGELLTYVDNAGASLGYGSKVDFFLIGQVGDAYIHFMWENLTGVQYFTTPYTPVLDRGIRFGVEWEFRN